MCVCVTAGVAAAIQFAVGVCGTGAFRVVFFEVRICVCLCVIDSGILSDRKERDIYEEGRTRRTIWNRFCHPPRSHTPPLLEAEPPLRHTTALPRPEINGNVGGRAPGPVYEVSRAPGLGEGGSGSVLVSVPLRSQFSRKTFFDAALHQLPPKAVCLKSLNWVLFPMNAAALFNLFGFDSKASPTN